jgi:hypothetical protein
MSLKVRALLREQHDRVPGEPMEYAREREDIIRVASHLASFGIVGYMFITDGVFTLRLAKGHNELPIVTGEAANKLDNKAQAILRKHKNLVRYDQTILWLLYGTGYFDNLTESPRLDTTHE